MNDDKNTHMSNTNDNDIISAIQKDGLYIKQVKKTPERCLAAVTQNGLVLKLIPKHLHTHDLCLAAVSQNGQSIEYVAPAILSHKIRIEAVKNDGMALSLIPVKYAKKRVCFEAVIQTGMALEFVPKQFVSKDICVAAIMQNGLSLQFVPSKMKNKQICEDAVSNNALALEFVPNRFKTQALCKTALLSNWKAFLFVPDSYYTLDNCLQLFECIAKLHGPLSEPSYDDLSYIKKIACRLPANINDNSKIVRLERIIRARRFEEKMYDINSNLFVIKEYICYKEEPEIIKFSSFKEFYKYIDGDLNNADLHDFDFKGVNLSDYNISGAYISSKSLIENNQYDASFYDKTIKDLERYTEFMPSATKETADEHSLAFDHESNVIINMSYNYDNSCNRTYYISDIHLNHKLLEAFPKHATKMEISRYISEFIKNLIDTTDRTKYRDYLLIAGDVSFNYDISFLFFEELVKQWNGSQIFVVLGNHELWSLYRENTQADHTIDIDVIIQQYRKMFSSLGINFLHNDLFIKYSTHARVIPEEHLVSISPDDLREACIKSSFILLGGLGFSGLNPEMNATHGIYRSAIKSLHEDIHYSKRFELLHKKVNAAIRDKQVIVLTHTPTNNWTKDVHVSKWIYVNGHTHQNELVCNDEKTIYADNQAGYYSRQLKLKHFCISKKYNIFMYYPDNIHIISREQYVEFNRGLGINMEFNRSNGVIHMLKKHEVYCFIFENREKGKFYLLNGGMITKLKHTSISYYFKNMTNYSNVIKNLTSGYQQLLKLISNDIKSFGGSGTIHGCILDIDFYNHVYVNPIDGTITPYCATSIDNKFVFSSIERLLIETRKDLYNNYTKLLKSKSEGIMLLTQKTIVLKRELSQFVSDTSMYKPSRIMKSLQYLTEDNVIRVWNDEIIDNNLYIDNHTRRIQNK